MPRTPERWEDSGVFAYSGTHHRVRIFVDFWNLFDSCKLASKNKIEVDYDLLLQLIFFECSHSEQRFEGVHFYVSTPESDPAAEKIVELLHKMRGIQVNRFSTKSRKRKCPYCQKSVRRREEKGADVALVTDMLSHAWNGSYDMGCLVSTDSDFIPAVRFLQSRGVKIVVASFDPDCELAQAAWGRLDLSIYWRYWGIR
jgi:uncharacterized LabA/DUF88 family protein